MKVKTSIISFFVVLTFIFSISINTISAAEALKPGDTIKVPVVLKANPGICSARIKFEYDEQVFTMISQENGDIFPLSSFVNGNVDGNDKYAVWVGLTDIDKTGTLIYLEFKIDDEARSGDYNISISYDANDVFNLAEENVQVDIENPIITIGTENDTVTDDGSSREDLSNGTGHSSGSNSKNSGITVKENVKTGAFENIKKCREYNNSFNDVIVNDWFYDSVKAGFEYELINGKSESEFDPYGNITVAEAITLADNIRNLYYGEDTLNVSDELPWYSEFVKYAISNKIVEDGFFDNYDRPILRKEMAYVFSKALPVECYSNINILKDIPDMTSDDDYYDYVLKLYLAGILVGDDAVGSFGGERVITRCESAAIANRLAIPNFRIAR